MLTCADCSAVFEHPTHVVERHGLDSPPYEEYDACPECYGMCLLEAMECSCCNEVIRETYVQVDNGERYCSECYMVRNAMDSR